jgi:hypothetical protein
VNAHIEEPPNGASARRGGLPMRDIKSDWRRWSIAERVGALMIGVAWLGTVSSLLVIGAG